MRPSHATHPEFGPKTLLAGFFCLAALGSCETLRDLTWAQGKGDNLFKIEEFDGKTFTAATGAKRFKGQTSRADELIAIDDFDQINNLDAVELSFSEGLFSEVDLRDLIFYGREKHTYTFEYGFTDHYVLLFKIAEKKDIPSQELTYAEASGPEQYKVPVMGLPISLYTVETIEDERGKETRRLNEYPRQYLHEATHFRIHLDGIKYFDAPGKQDLFPTSYFDPDDEWFFTKTLVGRPIDSTATLGYPLRSLKVKLVRTNNSILGVDLNIAEEQEVLDPTKTIVALEFPVEWVDFRLERSGQDAMLLETKLGDQEPTSRFWKDRAYALVDFNNADRLDKAFTLDNKLEKLEVGEDYLSFNIYESGTGYTFKYSLKKETRVKKGQKYFADDAELFHIFSQKRTVIGGYLFTQTPDIEDIVFANRFFPDPEKPEIVYHLSHNSPEIPEFVDAARLAVEAWDRGFQEADTGINVVFSPERAELGDVRYNQIVLYGYEIESGNLLGFGPSVQDTRSGETYSASVHIYLRTYREGLIRTIRSFIRNEIGLYDDKVVPQFELKNPFVPGTTGFFTQGDDPSRSDRLQGTVANLDFLNSATFASQPELVAKITDKLVHSEHKRDLIADYRKTLETNALRKTYHRCEHANVAASAISWEKIRRQCVKIGEETKFGKYLADLKAAHQQDPAVMNLPGESEAILECAQPLMKDQLVSTLIHELGHNLGLGHNFAASSDGRNYTKTADGRVAFPASSVMDYPDRDYDIYSQVGPYDIAAIGYLYGRTIQTSDGDSIDIPDGMSALDALQGKGRTVKSYRMCTDYEVTSGNLPMFDPLCVKWDVGANPLEYVRWAIQKIHANIIEQGYRYNSAAFLGALGATSYFSHFRQIHDYFRYLMQKQAGLYFEKVSPGDFTPQQLFTLMDSTRDPQLTKVYYDAVYEIFQFCRKVINLPSRVCLLEDAEDNSTITDVFEFRDLRDRIFDRQSATVQSCNTAFPLVGDVFDDMGISHDLSDKQFTDRGIEIDGLELDLDPAAASIKLKQSDFSYYKQGYFYRDDNPLYSSGLMDLKIAALRTLLWRLDNVMSVTQGAEVRNISFVDFPWFRDILYEDTVSRIVDGLSGVDVDARLKNSGRYFAHYREYEDFFWLRLLSLLDSVGDLRSKAYYHMLSLMPMRESSQSTFMQTLQQNDDIWWILIKNQYYLYESNQSYVGALLRTLVQITQLPRVLVLKDAIDNNTTYEEEQLATAIASAQSSDELLQAVVDYLSSRKLNLQPPQIKALASSLPSMDPVELLAAIREFLNKPIVTSPILSQLVERNDNDNLASLQAIITEYLESLY